jgi:hypothetical protein
MKKTLNPSTMTASAIVVRARSASTWSHKRKLNQRAVPAVTIVYSAYAPAGGRFRVSPPTPSRSSAPPMRMSAGRMLP